MELDPAALERLVRAALGASPSAIEAMPGGASTRRYLRIEAGKTRAVAMFVPDDKPEEVTSGQARARWPFLEVHALLDARGVRVPRVLAESCAEGLLLLEDLGDDTLAAFIEREPRQKSAIYTRAVEDLARAQRALAYLPEDSVVRTRAFDETLLRWELDHFREWGIDARGLELSSSDRTSFDGIADRLARRIGAWPRSFVHRDYQSRNLMVAGREGGFELVWIDFQDALLGPRVYDLVALLNDSYQSFEPGFVEARLDEYARAMGFDAIERSKLGREFDLVTVQRKLKDAGRFVFIDRVKKNPGFLPYVEPTLAKVRAALARLEDDADMRALAALIAKA